MKTAIKNLVNTLKRYRLSSVLNIVGLAAAFAAFLIIIMQIKHERTFDKVHEDSDRIFRVDRPEDEVGTYAAIVPRPFADAVFESSPHIKAATLINVWGGKAYVTVDEVGFIEQIVTCYPDIVDVFDFKFIEGDMNSLQDPEKVIIPQTTARKFFGNESAVGKSIFLEESIWTKEGNKFLTVGGVYRDFPENTQIGNNIYTAMDKSGSTEWHAQNSVAYILLDNPDSRETVEDNFNKIFDFKAHNYTELTRLELTPLTDIYFKPHELADIFKVGNPQTTKILLLIAILIIVIACINFVNFSTSLAPMRMRSINTQKVLGSSVSTLRRVLVFEGIGMSFIACFLAFFIVWIINKTQFLSFVTADISPESNLLLLGLMVILAIILGLVAGLYPAWYMTSFPPALVLKGSFGLSPSGRRLRTALIGVQYVISIGLIIGALFIQLQNNYMRSYDVGFKKDHIAMVDIGSKIYSESHELFTQKLKNYPGIEDVAYSEQRLGASDVYSTEALYYGEEEFYTYAINVSQNFLRLMDIPVISGRDFRESDILNDSSSVYIFNQNLKSHVDLESGGYVQNWRGKSYIAGFIDEVKLTSLRQGEDNVGFIANSESALPISYIRLREGVNIPEAVDHIRKSLAEIDASYPFSLAFYDTFFDQMYAKEESLNKMVSIFSLLAILLSLAGVLGLVIFETQYKRKEIGVRKVFGATIQSILIMFNTVYFRIIVVCFVVAAPIAFYFVKKWLENFVYRTSIHWWVFVVAFILISVITFLTVSFQNWKAATANPVDSVRSE